MRSTTESGNSSIESGVMEASAAQGLSLGPEEAEDRSSNPSDHDAGKGRVEDSAAGHAELLHAAAHAAALADDADGGEQDFSLGQRRTSKQGRPAARVDENRMRTMFGMPQPEAAKALGVSLTTLKQVCRRLGLSRWPYRRPSKGNARGSADTLNVPGHQQHALSTMPHKGPLWTGELLRDGDLCSPLMLQTPHGQQQFGASGMVGGGVPIVQGIGGCPPTRGFHMPRVCEPHPRSWNEAAVISGPNFAMAPGQQHDLEIRSQWWGSLGQRGGAGVRGGGKRRCGISRPQIRRLCAFQLSRAEGSAAASKRPCCSCCRPIAVRSAGGPCPGRKIHGDACRAGGGYKCSIWGLEADWAAAFWPGRARTRGKWLDF